jgi:hypothetical protein
MKSLSEIDTISKRSSRAAGYSWGIAEEVGKNVRLLEFFSLPGIKNLNAFLNRKKNIKLENLNLVTEDNSKNNSQYCPVIAGVNFLDQIKTLENLSEINFKNIAYPMLFLPFVSRASEIVGKRILLKIDDKEFLMNFNNCIYSNFSKQEIIKTAERVSIKILKNEDSFTENEWKELYKLSEETFVEENESLKNSGAGAGLTDND